MSSSGLDRSRDRRRPLAQERERRLAHKLAEFIARGMSNSALLIAIDAR